MAVIVSAQVHLEQVNDGKTGKGVKAIVEQYCLSTDNTTAPTSDWSTTQPEWTSGHYIWTRSQITWTDDSVTTTTPVLADAINEANSTANEAADKANTAESTAQNAENKADSAQGKLDSLSDSYINLFDKLYNTDNGDITNILSTLSSYWAYIGIDPSIPALIIGRSEAGTRMVLTDEQLQFLVNSNVPVVYLSNQRLYAPESEVTTLFFGVTDSSGNTIGTCGWIQRSNGHLSLKKIR